MIQRLFDIHIDTNLEPTTATKEEKKVKLIGRQETQKRIADQRKNKRIEKIAHEHEDMAFVQ